jgi:hypothetical protein
LPSASVVRLQLQVLAVEANVERLARAVDDFDLIVKNTHVPIPSSENVFGEAGWTRTSVLGVFTTTLYH